MDIVHETPAGDKERREIGNHLGKTTLSTSDLDLNADFPGGRVTPWTKRPLKQGYTPLHIAMMFGHEDIFNLLVKVYAADPNLRDWSGRKPRQYLTSQDMAVSADTFRSEFSRELTTAATAPVSTPHAPSKLLKRMSMRISTSRRRNLSSDSTC
uniref:Uncharacterized protein n=1 Tax=Timema bartmani TaxID=61472 RepID=A0A7R9HXK8_9NEOP|nr:unnamed protein product [Timema bartmani]